MDQKSSEDKYKKALYEFLSLFYFVQNEDGKPIDKSIDNFFRVLGRYEITLYSRDGNCKCVFNFEISQELKVPESWFSDLLRATIGCKYCIEIERWIYSREGYLGLDSILENKDFKKFLMEYIGSKYGITILIEKRTIQQ